MPERKHSLERKVWFVCIFFSTYFHFWIKLSISPSPFGLLVKHWTSGSSLFTMSWCLTSGLLGLKPRCRHNALWTLDRGELRGGSGGFRQGRAFSMTQRESSCSVPAPDKEAFEMFVFFLPFLDLLNAYVKSTHWCVKWQDAFSWMTHVSGTIFSRPPSIYLYWAKYNMTQNFELPHLSIAENITFQNTPKIWICMI